MTGPLRRSKLAERVEPHARLREEILHGLHGCPKTLPPKLFYDARGAQLFERITNLPEYYLARAELEILRERSAEIAELAGPRCALIEYGSGTGMKVRTLLDALERPAAYVPIDISGEQLQAVANSLKRRYPPLSVRPVCADYTEFFELPSLPPASRRVAFFAGSTIGNFHPTEATAFLRRIRRTVGVGGALVLGIDARKDRQTLEAAYNDAAGVTAAFNCNMLVRLNREFGADFCLDSFAHRAFFNDAASRIEMHLVSLATQTAKVAGEQIRFNEGESIWTESSYKYDEARLGGLANESGFLMTRLWTNAARQFWVAFLTAP